MDEQRLDSVIAMLEKRAAPDNRLEVVHGAHVWTAGFQWRAGASDAEIQQAEQALGRDIPADYCALLRTHNGAILYKDLKYGQWGFRLYGADELGIKNQEWRDNLRGKWRESFLAFCESLGDANVLVFDTSRPSPDGRSYAVLESSAFDPPEEWPTASRSFHDWLEHLVTAQGDKYWQWH